MAAEAMSEAATTEYNRPRRPSPDTINYLRSLPLDLDLALSEIHAFQSTSSSSTSTTASQPNDDTEFPPILAAALSALYEIRHEVASLSGDEHASSIVEMLCRMCCPVSATATCVVLEAVAPYVLHLSTHRYGSHVLQTILQLAASLSHQQQQQQNPSAITDLALHEDAPVPPPITLPSSTTSTVESSLNDWMLNIASTLEDYATDLVVHICGSHVLRTILCWLGGVEQRRSSSLLGHGGANDKANSNNTNATNEAQNRRGKAKTSKKKKRKPLDNAASSTNGSGRAAEYYLYPTSMAAKQNDNDDQQRAPQQYALLLRFTNALTTNATAAASSGSTSTSTHNTTPGTVQRWACHSSAGPVVTLLLQIWTYIDAGTSSAVANKVWEQQRQWEEQQSTPDRQLAVSRPEPHYSVGSTAHDIVRRLLCWFPNDTSDNENDSVLVAANVLYGLAGEPRGSHCLQTILRLSPDAVYADLLDLGKFTEAATIRDYIQNGHHDSETSMDADDTASSPGHPANSSAVAGINCSNFVIQTVLQTARTPQQATALLNAMDPSMAYILNPNHKRRGLLWRMAEMAVSFPDIQELCLRMISVGHHAYSMAGAKTKNTHIDSNTPSASKVNKCIPLILNMRASSDGERWQLDAEGTRALYYMLRFQPSTLVKDTIKGLFELTVEQLEGLAKNALGSRCVLDGILDSPLLLRDDAVLTNACKRLWTTLKGRWVGIAVDRIGHHTVKKLFRALRDIKDKECLVQELLTGKNRMLGNSMGRTVLDTLEVRVYESQGEAEWSKLIRSTMKKEEWLNEIVEGEGKDESSKRKATDSESGKSKSTKKGRITASVDSIVSAMVVPPAKKKRHKKSN